VVGVRDAVCLSCGARNPALFGFAPALRRLGGDLAVPNLILAACAVAYVVSLLLSPGALSGHGLRSLLAPSWPALFLLGGSGAEPVFGYGRWWTVLSAGWLHGGLLHIVFNMMWVRDLAPSVVKLFGAGRMVLVYLAGGVGGFLLTSLVALVAPGLPAVLHGGVRTIGASAPLFGLFGALICFGQRTGQRGVRQMVLGWVAMGVVFGVVFPGIDNWAHLGGFVSGWGTARLLDPLREERPGHVLAALAGLVASLVAVIASVITALPLVRG
jgi:rhomboid protease GluP